MTQKRKSGRLPESPARIRDSGTTSGNQFPFKEVARSRPVRSQPMPAPSPAASRQGAHAGLVLFGEVVRHKTPILHTILTRATQNDTTPCLRLQTQNLQCFHHEDDHHFKIFMHLKQNVHLTRHKSSRKRCDRMIRAKCAIATQQK